MLRGRPLPATRLSSGSAHPVPVKILRTAFLFLAAYSATGTAMVVKSRLVPLTYPATRTGLPPYPQASHVRRHART